MTAKKYFTDDERKAAAQAYQREWHSKPENRERVRAKARENNTKKSAESKARESARRRVLRDQKLAAMTPEAREAYLNRERARSRAYYRENTEAASGRFKQYYEANREALIQRSVRQVCISKYGLKIEDRDALLASQDGKCAICEKAVKFGVGRSGYDVCAAVDHCHATDRVRGVLCMNCNRSLGLMRDSPARLRAAAAYLERTASRTAEAAE